MRFVLCLGLMAFVACDWSDDRDPDADKPVIGVAICPAGGCTFVADGKTLIPVQVSTGAATRPADLMAEVRTSAGRWASLWAGQGTPTLAEVNLSAQPTEELLLVSPADAGVLTVRATLKGHHATAGVELTMPAQALRMPP